MDTHDVDVVVVGCGIAGLSAAMTAAEHGARVAVLERAPEDERGGNTRYTESFWRMQSEDAVSEDFEDRFAANSGGWPDPGILQDAVRDRDNQPAVLRSLSVVDPEIVATLAEEAPKALKWLRGFGVKFDFLPLYFLSQSTTRMGPIGGGLALIEALGKAAEARAEQITFHYETAARDLITDDLGQVRGVTAVTRGNRPVAFRGGAVVLASGGFEGNPEMLSHYVGAQAQFIRPVARGGHYNRGEGLRMALAAGAAPCGDYGSFHAQPVDPRATDWEPVVLNYSYGVLINRQGMRFTDEGPAMVDATYEEVTREIMGQPEGLAFAVFDASLDDVDNWQVTVRSRVPPHEADDWHSLAAAMGVDGDRLAATIAAFNAACPASDGFDPLRPDGLATRGLSPAKSHWARPLLRPPFRAWPMICSNCFTFGGLKIDNQARVINTEGDVMPGLYAAGEVAGLYYRTYTGATSVMRGAVTGRLAGADAARRRNTA
ncbi:MAG: FAD-dependent oxidoreductase [Pseudomonadota bacterium]|nr:FAD-dependent oxidoreductase [Pseudomonadota bacterium]